MKDFYTNIQVIGDEMLVRAMMDGKKENYREEFYPTLFCPTKNQTKFKNVKVIAPIKNQNTDDTNFNEILKNAWAVVNHSSNPAMQSVFNGVPVFVSEASLSYDVGNTKLGLINREIF